MGSRFQTGASEDNFGQMQRVVEEMQMSLSEREAEIIRLNLCLGDERKRNSDLLRLQEMPMPADNTPKRVMSRSSSRGVPPAAPTLHQPQLSMGSEGQYSLAPR